MRRLNSEGRSIWIQWLVSGTSLRGEVRYHLMQAVGLVVVKGEQGEHGTRISLQGRQRVVVRHAPRRRGDDLAGRCLQRGHDLVPSGGAGHRQHLPEPLVAECLVAVLGEVLEPALKVVRGDLREVPRGVVEQEAGHAVGLLPRHGTPPPLRPCCAPRGRSAGCPGRRPRPGRPRRSPACCSPLPSRAPIPRGPSGPAPRPCA